MNYQYRMLCIMLILFLAGSSFLAGCVGEDKANGQQDIKPDVGSPKNLRDSFFGSGDQKTIMPLSAGVHLLTLEIERPTGSEPIKSIVSIMTEKDAISLVGGFTKEVLDDTQKNETYYWTQAFMLEEDADASVEVSQLDHWTLTFGNPEMINGIPPQTFTGIGNQATPFFMIPKGNYTCHISSEECTVIGAGLMDYRGNYLMDGDRESPMALHQLLDNDWKPYVGSYNRTFGISIDKGDNYLFNIISDGKWEVTLSPVGENSSFGL